MARRKYRVSVLVNVGVDGRPVVIGGAGGAFRCVINSEGGTSPGPRGGHTRPMPLRGRLMPQGPMISAGVV